jgi:hypothetical protein
MDHADAFDYLVETLRGGAANFELNLWRVVEGYLYKYEQAAGKLHGGMAAAHRSPPNSSSVAAPACRGEAGTSGGLCSLE